MSLRPRQKTLRGVGRVVVRSLRTRKSSTPDLLMKRCRRKETSRCSPCAYPATSRSSNRAKTRQSSAPSAIRSQKKAKASSSHQTRSCMKQTCLRIRRISSSWARSRRRTEHQNTTRSTILNPSTMLRIPWLRLTWAAQLKLESSTRLRIGHPPCLIRMRRTRIGTGHHILSTSSQIVN